MHTFILFSSFLCVIDVVLTLDSFPYDREVDLCCFTCHPVTDMQMLFIGVCMQIATRYLMPELAGTRLTPKLYRCVSEAFVAKFGEYAGWAQNVLFIGELPSQKVPIRLEVATLSKTESGDDEKRETKIAVANILSDDGSITR